MAQRLRWNLLLACVLIAGLLALQSQRPPAPRPAPPPEPPQGPLPAAPAPAQPPAEEPKLKTASFAFYRGEDLPLGDLADAAERVRAATYAWAGAPPRDAARPLPVYLCRTQDEVFAIEKERKLPYAADPRRKAWSPAGGFYREVPMIAVQVYDVPHARVTFCHEVVHSVIEELAPSCPDAINEGVAELLSVRIAATPEQLESERSWRRRYATAALARGEPLLRPFMDLEYFEFRGERNSEHFVLGYCLAAVLERQEFREAVPGYFRRLRSGGAKWDAFARAFPAEVEAEWAAQIRRCAAGDG